ncbi:MAG: hypothetical protein ACD_8C00029G0020, partial [uncultured bacterium]
DFTAVDVSETMGTPMGTAGVCESLSSGDCSVANLTAAFGQKATEASSICNGESNGTSVESGTDYCTGNGTGYQPKTGQSGITPSHDSVSIGLFQVNISAHDIGLGCTKAFNTAYTSTIAKDKTKCWVVNRSLYDSCVTAAKNATTNISAAKSIYSGAGNSWAQWGANKHSGCNFH